MDDQNSIFDQIQEILGSFGGNFSILEHQVDVKVQMEYFEFVRNCNRAVDAGVTLQREAELYDPNHSIESKKELLAQLAAIEKPEAYRAIERFVGKAGPEIGDWSILALQECRIRLESRLLEENQVFISTGLGGKDGKLRYFIALFPENGIFTNSQKMLIESEFNFAFRKHDAVVENIEFKEGYASVVGLISLNVPVKDPIQAAIDECNSLGHFIKRGFLITNVKILSPHDIENLLNNQHVDGLPTLE